MGPFTCLDRVQEVITGPNRDIRRTLVGPNGQLLQLCEAPSCCDHAFQPVCCGHSRESLVHLRQGIGPRRPVCFRHPAGLKPKPPRRIGRDATWCATCCSSAPQTAQQVLHSLHHPFGALPSPKPSTSGGGVPPRFHARVLPVCKRIPAPAKSSASKRLHAPQDRSGGETTCTSSRYANNSSAGGA